ncbi:MAG: cysteine hydrolase [Anaerolineae bacterium]|nr:cysteine hydrolase [Gemmatimonadaceae bacterium]
MPSRNLDLHGNVPDKSGVALLLIDVINDLEFDDGQALLEQARPMATALSRLKRQAKAQGIPVVYVNDNFGKWQSDLRKLIEHCFEDDVRGREIVEKLRPDDDDYFVLKPKHSGFFSTTLDTLLDYLQVHTVILTGVATNICVLFTANDAYMRDLRLVVPSDCVAANDADVHTYAIEQMRMVLKADIRPSTELDLSQLSEHPESRNAEGDGD